MSVVDLLILLVVAAICGSLGQAVVGFSRGGFHYRYHSRIDWRHARFLAEKRLGLTGTVDASSRWQQFPCFVVDHWFSRFPALITFLTGRRR